MSKIYKFSNYYFMFFSSHLRLNRYLLECSGFTLTTGLLSSPEFSFEVAVDSAGFTIGLVGTWPAAGADVEDEEDGC